MTGQDTAIIADDMRVRLLPVGVGCLFETRVAVCEKLGGRAGKKILKTLFLRAKHTLRPVSRGPFTPTPDQFGHAGHPDRFHIVAHRRVKHTPLAVPEYKGHGMVFARFF